MGRGTRPASRGGRVSHARRAMAVAEAATRAAASRGVTLPVDLRLWQLVDRIPAGPVPPEAGALAPSASAAPASDEGDVVDHLAAVLEAVTPPTRRRATGLHVTPSWLADQVVGMALDGLDRSDGPAVTGGPTVCDPACGGGAFLLAVARALEARGVDRPTVVREHLWGADVDPVGLAAAEAALAVWAGEAPPPGRLVQGDTLTRPAAGLWPDLPAEGFAAVVGNPPFLNQLESATVRSSRLTERLRRRFGEAVQPYTDTAWLFLLAACEMARPGGRVAMVQPLSLGAARDAAAVRAVLDQRAELCQLWADGERRSFAAAVEVCVPVLQVRPPSGPRAPSAPTGPGGEGRAPNPNRWAERLADVSGIPAAELADGPTVGQRAKVVAGFREEYYGIVPLVAEADDVEPDVRHPLVTAGVLDWGHSAWGRRPSRFAKRSWAAPVVDLARRDDPEIEAGLPPGCRRWLGHTTRPKVVVATQTQVVELAVDAEGRWVASVPTVIVVPHDVADLWLLAAAMASPSATAWLARRAPGVALTRHALKVSARDLSALPLPVDRAAWDEAAAQLRAYAGDPTEAAFDAYTAAAAAAYDAPGPLVAWWRARGPRSKRNRRERDGSG
jgi:N-6 DNA methylase